MLSWPPNPSLESAPARFRLIGLDLDSTLQPDGSIHPADRAAVRAAHAASAKIALVSALPPRSMLRYWAQLGLGTPVIALNGALVYDFPAHKHILGQPIEPEKVVLVLRTIRETAPKAAVGVECGDTWAVNRLSHVANRQIKRYGMWPSTVGNLQPYLEKPLYQVWAEAGPEELALLEERLSGKGLALMRYTDPDRLLIRSPAASRGWALMALANWLEIPPHQVMAIGDGGRDRSMLQAAAFAVVTSGVTDQAGTVSTEGVAEAFRRYLDLE